LAEVTTSILAALLDDDLAGVGAEEEAVEEAEVEAVGE